MNKLSVIIPACNEEHYIGKTLESLRNQTLHSFETIVICNGCRDNTKQIAEQYGITVLELDEANVSKARNYGAQHSNGEILIFLDADTTLEDDALKKIRRAFTDKHAVATTLLQPDKEKWSYNLSIKFKNFYNSKNIYKGCSGVLICRKKDFDKVGGYPELHVKEHRKLTIKLKEHGQYKTIHTYATTSMRRYDKWGIPKVTAFWVAQWAKNYLGNLNDSNYKRIR